MRDGVVARYQRGSWKNPTQPAGRGTSGRSWPAGRVAITVHGAGACVRSKAATTPSSATWRYAMIFPCRLSVSNTSSCSPGGLFESKPRYTRPLLQHRPPPGSQSAPPRRPLWRSSNAGVPPISTQEQAHRRQPPISRRKETARPTARGGRPSGTRRSPDSTKAESGAASSTSPIHERGGLRHAQILMWTASDRIAAV